ncbi:hypothetical protein N5E02_14925 [Stenotrophomonas sp. GD03777]|uniref:hypothetical protein n=1 Tax=unclassified Stenotrophomonas TaxID=196198 RepID=UPI001BAFF51D|nr:MULTISPECIES: hypothetical protein [unclassified Stenotrophomonas]MDH1662686.1 hypothetical protein [Stenotrophomonas sp. GD03777]
MAGFMAEVSVILPDTVIFGGVVREFSLGHAKDFCSDLDLVTRHSRGNIERFLQGRDWVRNKFGGYRVLQDKWMYDLWSLEDTWAARAGYIACSDFDDLLRTTFFDIDSAAFHISSRRLIMSAAHVEAVRSKRLGINLAENPSPSAMARRAVRMAMRNELSLSRELADYVVSNYCSAQPNSLESGYVHSLKRLLDAGECELVHPEIQPDFFRVY